MTNVRIAGAVVLYNPMENVVDNIKTYLDDVEKLYIVDNSDNDNFKRYINDKKIEYIPNCENLGIAVALNMAAKRAIEDNFNWLLTMDQDSKFEIGDLKILEQYIYENDTKDVGIVGAYQKIKAISEEEIPKENYSDVELIMTSGNLLNLDIYKKIGEFREDFFIDAVDLEYCIRIKKSNYKIIRNNYVLLNHELGDIKSHRFLWKKKFVTNHNYIRRYYIMRNNLYISKIYDDAKYKRDFLLGQFKELVKIILYEKDKYKKIRSMYRGYRDYKRNVKGKYSY